MTARSRLTFTLAIATTAVAASVPAALARPSTTEPENFVIFTVKVTPSGVTFTPDPTVTRGTTGEFKIVNRTKTPLRFELAGRASKLIKPKTRTIFFLLMYARGTYTWHTTGPGAVHRKGTFEVT